MQDAVDRLLGQWTREQPGLDCSGLALVVRIQRLAKLTQQGAERVLAPLDLKLWEYDVLSALRRQGEPFALPATELARAALLTSGAMTTRIDRLANRGLVLREPRSCDRRGVNVRLTRPGLRLVDQALEARMRAAGEIVAGLPASQRGQLDAALRQLLLGLEPAG